MLFESAGAAMRLAPNVLSLLRAAFSDADVRCKSELYGMRTIFNTPLDTKKARRIQAGISLSRCSSRGKLTYRADPREVDFRGAFWEASLMRKSGSTESQIAGWVRRV